MIYSKANCELDDYVFNVYEQFVIKKNTPLPVILLSLRFLSEFCYHCSLQDTIISLL